MTDTTELLRRYLAGEMSRGGNGTHWDGCHASHSDCFVKWLCARLGRAEGALEAIGHDHETQARFAATGDWHGLYNWAQDKAKEGLGEDK